MAETPTNITTDILIAIREDIAAFRGSVEQKLQTMEGRLTRVDETLRKSRRDSAGMLVMMRATSGFFDERVGDIEARVAALEGKTS
jgi:hypothetical protein